MIRLAPKTGLLVLLLAFAAGGSRARSQTPGDERRRPRKNDVPALIDKLQRIDRGGIGYMPTVVGSGFLPLGIGERGAMLLGQAPATDSDTLRELVRRGAAAVPHLIAHLGDRRPTRMVVKHEFGIGGMFFDDEYDYNHRTAKRPPRGVNRDDRFATKHPTSHAVTVGDLCFVALGQIVNRHFNAVRYQPTACIMVNSPTYSAALRKAIREEWGGLTLARHKESLARDFREPDSEYRRLGACVRLGYYYPEALEPLALKQLAEPRYDSTAVETLVRESLYSTRDAARRKKLFDAFVARHGEAARQGILLQLFGDLDTQEADEQGRLGPPLKDKYAARACLVELYGYPKGVKSKDRPWLLPTDNYVQARLVDALAPFATPKLDRAVRRILHATDDDYLASSCVKYLLGRGADADIRKYVAKHLPGADANRRRELEALRDRLGWTPLHLAAEAGDADRVEDLIDKGAAVNAQAANGQTPLHVAAAAGSTGALCALLKHKANPDATDREGRTPLRLALSRTYVDDGAVQALLASGAAIADIRVAAFAGRADLVKGFLQKDRRQAGARTGAGETPLHLAARLGHVRVAEALLAGGADVNARDRSQFTPLHNAAMYGQRRLVTLLLAHHGDRGAKSWQGRTPLDYARQGKDREIGRLLEQGP